jgi:hypothetical protein
MRNVAVLSIFFLALALLWAPGAYSQATGQSPQNQSQLMRAPGTRNPRSAVPQQVQPQPATAGPAVAAPPQAQPQPQPETAKESSIEVKDGKLSVDVTNADLGSVMNQIGAKMNVPVQVNGAVFSRKITTKFSGLDIDRGIERLLTLAKENNYLIRYNEKGGLSGIELYADNPAPSSGQRVPGLMSPASGVAPNNNNPVFRRRYRRFTPPQPQQQPAQQQSQPTVEQVE